MRSKTSEGPRSPREAIADEIRKALYEKAAEVERTRRPSDREIVHDLADDISDKLRGRMPWKAIFESFQGSGVTISLATLKSYYQQALRDRRDGGGMKAASVAGKRAPKSTPKANPQAEPVKAATGHRKIIDEDC